MNYASLVTQIEEFLQNDESSFVSNIPNFVRQAEEDIYNNCQIPALRKPVSGSLTASNRFLSLPTDFISAYSLSITDSSVQYFLLNKEQDFMREAFPNPSTTGRPRYYAFFDKDSLIVAPTPLSSYAAELHYFYKPESIVTASTTWLGTNAPNALLYGALVQAYVYMKGDPELLQYYREEYLRALANLQVISEGRMRKDTYRVMNAKEKV